MLVQRAVLEDLLIKRASSQSILQFLSRARAEKQFLAHSRLPFVSKSQSDRLRQMVMKILGLFRPASFYSDLGQLLS